MVYVILLIKKLSTADGAVFWASISETNVDLVLWYSINRSSFSSNSNSNFAAKDKLAMADSRIRNSVGTLKTVVSAVVGEYLRRNLIYTLMEYTTYSWCLE